MSKIAICSICYNESQIIEACIKNWKGLVDKHLVLVSSQPWNGSPYEDDGTAILAKSDGAEVIVGYWDNEPQQRNWGLARLWDYDYVLIVDPDELYLKKDQEEILKRLNDPFDYVNKVMKPLPAFRCENMITYWKTSDYVFDPPDKHKPFIAVDPKQVQFYNKREIRGITKEPSAIQYAPIIEGVSIHHMSWVKSDKKVAEKINTYSHNVDISSLWYDKVWMKWEPNSTMLVRPYGSVNGEQSKAIFKQAPQEIVELMKK